jgi:hypothetical protein
MGRTYVPHSLEVIHSVNSHCFIMNTSLYEAYTFVIWLIRFKKDVTRKKSWVQPFFDKSGQLGSLAVPTELDQESEGFISFYTRQGKVLNFYIS